MDWNKNTSLEATVYYSVFIIYNFWFQFVQLKPFLVQLLWVPLVSSAAHSSLSVSARVDGCLCLQRASNQVQMWRRAKNRAGCFWSPGRSPMCALMMSAPLRAPRSALRAPLSCTQAGARSEAVVWNSLVWSWRISWRRKTLHQLQ